MYSRNSSIGSWPTRIAARFAEALISPELVSAVIRASIASSIWPASTISSQIRSASGSPATRAPQAQVGGAGDDPLLARRQVQAHAADGDHVVHHVQELAGAADGELLDAGDPHLLRP